MDEREDGAREDHGAALKRPSVGLAARVYLRRGWGLVELRPRSKAPVQPGWQETRIGAATVDAIFLPGCNIGLLTGMASAGLVDVDCDTVEARIAATTLLPQTPMAHGRTNGRENGQFTHHWYQIVGDLPKTEKFAWGEQTPQTPADGNARETPRAAMQTAMQTTMLIELRADGCQTMVPPSVHPDGGWLRWGGGRVEPLEPARVTAATLRQAVARTAAAALLARYWPARGSRDQAALSLAGWLAQEGWTDDEVETFILATARAAQDEEWKQRVGKAAHTRETLAAGKPVMGDNALAERLRGGTAHGAMVVTLVARWLGIHTRTEGQGGQSSGMAPLAALTPSPVEAVVEARLGGTLLSDVQPRAVEWLWQDHIPPGGDHPARRRSGAGQVAHHAGSGGPCHHRARHAR